MELYIFNKINSYNKLFFYYGDNKIFLREMDR